MENKLFFITMVTYVVATISYIIYASFKDERIGKISMWILAAGLLCQTIALILRLVATGRGPFVTIYETMVFWSWLIALIFLIFQFRYRIRVLGVLIAPLAFLAIALASLFSSETQNLVPALQSYWLEFHIATCFVAYACFAISFAAGLAYLIKRTDKPESMLSKENLDIIGYKSISLGFPFLTLGVVLGAIWGNVAWGRYWGWDPKETWSLITWFIYALYLHLRIVSKLKAKHCAIVSIVGLLAVIFTFFGVNFLLSGLHAYQ